MNVMVLIGKIVTNTKTEKVKTILEQLRSIYKNTKTILEQKTILKRLK
jgi:hypothetical protein